MSFVIWIILIVAGLITGGTVLECSDKAWKCLLPFALSIAMVVILLYAAVVPYGSTKPVVEGVFKVESFKSEGGAVIQLVYLPEEYRTTGDSPRPPWIDKGDGMLVVNMARLLGRQANYPTVKATLYSNSAMGVDYPDVLSIRENVPAEETK